MRTTLRNALLVLASAAALGGCQSYNVDPVKPGAVKVAKKPQQITGHKLSPNIMFVVDRSGSMTDSASGDLSQRCDNGSGTYVKNDPATGQPYNCKWNNLIEAMNGSGSDQGFIATVFSTLSVSGDQPRLGLVTFADPEHPNGTTVASCTPGAIRVAIPTSAASTVDQIKSTLLATTPAGATPTASTLALVAPYFPPATADRDNYVVLLTDGAPNCNSGITPTEQACGGERCTSNCNPSDWANCGCNPTRGGSNAALLCLDDSALSTAITNLRVNSQIKTFVIGFGADVAQPRGAAHDTLNAAAQAGGVPKNDPTYSYYQATSLTELKDALTAILGNINQGCDYNLDSPPASDKAIQVIVVAPGATACTSDADCSGGICAGPDGNTRCGRALNNDEVVVSGSKVSIKDVAPNNACKTISDSTGSNPAAVEFRYISK